MFFPRPALGLEAGQEVVVRYGDDARFLHTGRSYLFNVSGNSVDDLRGSVMHGPCGPSGNDTRHADGSEINTSSSPATASSPTGRGSAWRSSPSPPSPCSIRWRINVKHPRLTIDGQPLTKKR